MEQVTTGDPALGLPELMEAMQAAGVGLLAVIFLVGGLFVGLAFLAAGARETTSGDDR